MVVECPVCGLKTTPFNVQLHIDRGCPRIPAQQLGSSPPGRVSRDSFSEKDESATSKRSADHKSGENNQLHANLATKNDGNDRIIAHNEKDSDPRGEELRLDRAQSFAFTDRANAMFNDKKAKKDKGQYLFNAPTRELTGSSPLLQGKGTEGSRTNRVIENNSSPNMISKRVNDEQGSTPKRPALEKDMKLSNKPLAERCRPKALDDFVGQKHLVGPNGILRSLIYSGSIPSMILWGPSGVGKTTFARILARECKAQCVELSAPQASTNDIKSVVADARNLWRSFKKRTILFLDEIHRFNRAQQDSLLAAVENGDIVLVGATTENPSFKLNGALLSRTRVFILESLDEQALQELIERALGIIGAELDTATKVLISQAASGDGRIALNMLETVLSLPEPRASDQVKEAIRSTMVYDQKGDFHYDNISAFHKSVRGSDANAAMYYLARMLEGGEDPMYVARRMVRIASEDVGVADESCLPFAIAAMQAAQQIGMPESDVILAHCAVKLARAPKSVEVYKAYGRLKSDLANDPALAGAAIPMHLRNAPTKLMKDAGYGAGYKYNPDYDGPVEQEYMPSSFVGKKWLKD